MGGTIWFESQENIGTTFYFTIRSQSAGKANMPTPLYPQRRIVLVGDMPTMLQNINAQKRKIECFGYQNVTVTSPENCQIFSPWDLIFCNRAEAYKAVIQHGIPSPNVYLVDYKQTIPNVNFLKKPSLGSALLAVLNSPPKQETWLSTTTTMTTGQSSSSCNAQNHREFKNLRLLVAEDNFMNQKVLMKMLENLGYKDVKFVMDGRQAVEAVKSSCYDVVLMDIQV